MSYDDYESTADLNEGIYYDRLDADLEMAEMTREGNRLAAMRKQGICTHGSMQGSHPIYAPDIPKGMQACTSGCGGLWPETDWPRAGETPEQTLEAYKTEIR